LKDFATEIASESELKLHIGSNVAENSSRSCDIGRIAPKAENIVSDAIYSSDEVDANVVTNSASVLAPTHTDESTAHLLSDGKENIASDTTGSGATGVERPVLSDGMCTKEDPQKSEESLFTITIRNSESAADTSSVWNADVNGGLDMFSSKTADASVSPCVASFSSSSCDESSFDESFMPDWKLETNAYVKLDVLPHDQVSEYKIFSENKDISSKQVLQPIASTTSSKLAFVQPLLSKMSSEPKNMSAESPVSVKSEMSASPSLMEDMLAKHLELAKHIDALPVSDSLTNVTSSLSLPKQPSTTVALIPVQRKRFSYLDYCNSLRFQPVVRLVRLPLEFFHMLQHTSQSAATPSVSVSYLSKRFMILTTN